MLPAESKAQLQGFKPLFLAGLTQVRARLRARVSVRVRIRARVRLGLGLGSGSGPGSGSGSWLGLGSGANPIPDLLAGLAQEMEGRRQLRPLLDEVTKAGG